MQLITSDKLIVYVDENDEISGGTIEVNGKTYENVTPVAYSDALPPDIVIPEKYIYENGAVKLNPDFEGSDINTRLNDIEQILIDLLDTM